MIHELLSYGSETAKTGRYLATLLGCDIRTVTAQIERERRAGQPICANMRGENTGYYLAADDEELDIYCTRLLHRSKELLATRRALVNIMENRNTK